MEHTADQTEQIVAQALQQVDAALAYQREFEARLGALGIDLQWAEATVANASPEVREKAQALLGQAGIAPGLVDEAVRASIPPVPRVLRDRLKARI